ncbi:MAG: two-component system sensor protein [Bryobacterales bacterium]|nr:two-component system sensor protein [Bryobacterales bacterium]
MGGVMWSTWLSQPLAIASIVLPLGYAYYFHRRNVERQFKMRLEERLGERARIARELHDTLLQSFQGLMLRFQKGRNLLPASPHEAIQALDSALDRAAQAIAEGQDAIRELRSCSVIGSNLTQAITVLGEELTATNMIEQRKFRVVVEGMPRDLPPILGDEIYGVAREALRNVFRHAQARRIEVEIRYGERQFRLRVRDNGKGIDPKLLMEQGRGGHWGLPGMRERAELIGARLDVWSELEVGTEVELTIPASIAYATSPASRRPRELAS